MTSVTPASAGAAGRATGMPHRLTAGDERFLRWVSWAAMGAAILVACAIGLHLSQANGRWAMMVAGKERALPMAGRVLLGLPGFVFVVVPVVVAAACVVVQVRVSSRVVASLFHLLVMGVSFGCFLVARDVIMTGMIIWGLAR